MLLLYPSQHQLDGASADLVGRGGAVAGPDRGLRRVQVEQVLGHEAGLAVVQGHGWSPSCAGRSACPAGHDATSGYQGKRGNNTPSTEHETGDGTSGGKPS